ncbi:hypothetical protein [Solimonas flava]|uniref:hypothetical protein n=1 Tax=Solimonas flava TaxID=415849 RepID=UPI000427FDA6|nr:hypothetical protein [Solimonas flava]
MRLVQGHGSLPFDGCLPRFPPGLEIPPHVDPVSAGCRYRLNIVLRRAREGGEFECRAPIWTSRRVKLFRPDVCLQRVTPVRRGTRYVLSIGWVRQDAAAGGPR